MGDCYYHGSYYGNSCSYCNGELSDKNEREKPSDFVIEINKIEGVRFKGYINKSKPKSNDLIEDIVRDACVIAKNFTYYNKATFFEIAINENDEVWIWYQYGIETSYQNLGDYKSLKNHEYYKLKN